MDDPWHCPLAGPRAEAGRKEPDTLAQNLLKELQDQILHEGSQGGPSNSSEVEDEGRSSGGEEQKDTSGKGTACSRPGNMSKLVIQWLSGPGDSRVLGQGG